MCFNEATKYFAIKYVTLIDREYLMLKNLKNQLAFLKRIANRLKLTVLFSLNSVLMPRNI